MLKLGYEPVIVVVPLPVSETVWSGAVLVIVIDPSPLDILCRANPKTLDG
jgi:hypothetical protein